MPRPPLDARQPSLDALIIAAEGRFGGKAENLSEIENSLPDAYATIKRPVPHRETILRLTLDRYVKRYGPDTPLDLDRLNGLLAATGQPLATETEINVWYGRTVPARQRN